jgi:TonB family protein
MKRSLITATALCCLAGFITARAQETKQPADSIPSKTTPVAAKQVQPDYPEAARGDSIEGTVWLKVYVDESGRVIQASVQKSDNEMFNEPAIATARQWTFKPVMQEGKPVGLWVSIPYKFKLPKKENVNSAPVSGTIEVKQKPPAEDLKVDKDPEAIKQVNPKYPGEAFLDGKEGIVWTKMWIDTSGNVVEAKVSKTDNDVFNEAAIDAGKQWKFKPALLNGKPVAVWITVPFRFAIGPK